MTTEIEAKKRASTSFSANSSDTIPQDKISQPMHDFSSMVCDIVQLLQHCDGALERMLITFKQVAIVMKSVTYTALVNSEEYDNINSVRAFFRLLTPYWNPIDCSLLAALVKASECKAAIQRLQAYLSSRNKVGEDVVLGEEIKDSDILLPAVTGKDVLVTDTPANVGVEVTQGDEWTAKLGVEGQLIDIHVWVLYGHEDLTDVLGRSFFQRNFELGKDASREVGGVGGSVLPAIDDGMATDRDK